MGEQRLGGEADPSAPRLGAGRPALLWLLATLLYWATIAGTFLITGKISWGSALVSAALSALPDALLVPAALLWTRRWAWGRVPVISFTLAHLAGAIVFVTLSTGAMVLAWGVRYYVEKGHFQITVGGVTVIWKGLISLLVYVSSCGIGQASISAQRARREAERAARAESLRAQAELAGLRAQFNPHFILNLLHSLMGLVSRDPPVATAALEKLGDVLRYVLQVQRQDRDEVSLSEEWKFVEDYLSLEKLRLGTRLQTRLEAEPEALASRVPPFVLQFLVENAVRHAIAPRAQGGRLEVRAQCRDGTLRLSVADDGDGRATGPTTGQGLGLRLVSERLCALYGGQAGLRTGISALGGFEAEVVVPRREELEGEFE
ncbi:MAG TPA: histidine kinase [Thermoanaerobaculia bacterium]|nr:histidine kinase [Thermoanaerobaculia bacterium]